MSEWRIVTFKDIAEFNPRESIKKGEVATKVAMDKLQPFCRDIPEVEHEAFSGGTKFRNGDTIMARITPCLENGKIAMVNVLEKDEVGFGSTEYIVFRAKEGVTDPHFLYYLVCSPAVREPAIKSMVGSSGRQRVQTDVVQNLEFDIPSYDEQKIIGDFLKKLDDKISVNNQINRNLSEQARLLYKSWFIDFNNNDGVMPDDWHVGAVSEIIELHDSKRKPLSGNERDKLEKIYPYYGATSIMDYVDDYLFDGIYLLLGEDGSVIDSDGYPILQYVFGKFWCNNHAHIITGKNGFSVEMLYLLFSLTHVNDIVTGAVQLKISQQNLNKVEVVIPSLSALKEFDELIQPMFGQIRKLRLENENLTTLRDSLLPKLMSGELDVSNLNI